MYCQLVYAFMIHTQLQYFKYDATVFLNLCINLSLNQEDSRANKALL